MSFSIATRDELWLHGRLVERRLSYGRAIEDELGMRASDEADDALVAKSAAEIEALRTYVVPDARTRIVIEASSEGMQRTIVVTLGQRSVVTEPEHFERDVALLRNSRDGEMQPRPVPLLWRNGSAAVLLHEAIGHPLEHGQPSVPLPPWLAVEVPLCERRASFKDVPLVRMTDVIARQIDAPFVLPAERIEIELVDGGAYDPLTERITLRIAAATLIERNEAHALAPFAMHETRTNVVRSIVGATGEPLRYPGVICSREGQELVVGSYAPLMLTEPR